MKKRVISLLVIITLLITSTLSNITTMGAYANPPETKAKFIIKHSENEKIKRKFFPDEYSEIVDSSDETIEDAQVSNNMKFKKVSKDVVSVEATLNELEELINNPEILSVEYDQAVVISEDYSINLQSIGEHNITDPDFNGSGIKVAILDTGIDTNNTDLNVVGGVSFIEGSDFNDDNGHGTALASIIAAQDNGEGLIGISPDVELYSVKVLDSNGTGYYSNVIKGLEWCVENRIDIVLMSFGADEYSGILHESIQKAYFQDTLLIGAAGNSEITVQYPAAYTEVMAVDAVNQNGSVMYEKINSELVDIYAIGENVETYDLSGLSTKNGSSFSAAHVVGVAAELWSNDPLKTNDMVREHLVISANETENNIKILDAYQVYVNEIEGIDVDSIDNSGEIDPNENPNAEVSVLAESELFTSMGKVTSVKVGTSFYTKVWFSNDHSKVVASLKKSDGTHIQTVELSSISYGYDWDLNEYTGSPNIFNFSPINELGSYKIEYLPYDTSGSPQTSYIYTQTFSVTEDSTPEDPEPEEPVVTCDLIVNSVYVNTDIILTDAAYQGEDIKASATILNIGTGNFEGVANIKATLDSVDSSGNPTGEVSVHSQVLILNSANVNVPVGKELIFEGTSSIPDGDYQLTVSIDWISGTDETSDSNNSKVNSEYLTIMKRYDAYRAVRVLVGDPVDIGTGSYTVEVSDLSIGGKAPIELKRIYDGKDYRVTSLGNRWRHSYDMSYEVLTDYIKVYFGEGSIELFSLKEDGTYEFDSAKYQNVYLDAQNQLVIEFKVT